MSTYGRREEGRVHVDRREVWRPVGGVLDYADEFNTIDATLVSGAIDESEFRRVRGRALWQGVSGERATSPYYATTSTDTVSDDEPVLCHSSPEV